MNEKKNYLQAHSLSREKKILEVSNSNYWQMQNSIIKQFKIPKKLLIRKN